MFHLTPKPSPPMWVGRDTFVPVSYTHLDVYKRQGKFDQSGFVHLQNCEIGNNEKLLAAFARIINVPVYAGTGSHNSVLRLNTGDYVRANPDGSISRNVARP